MNKLPHFALLFAALALVAADKAKKPKDEKPKESGAKKTDQELIQGKWRISRMSVNGRVRDMPSRFIYVFMGNHLSRITLDGKKSK